MTEKVVTAKFANEPWIGRGTSEAGKSIVNRQKIRVVYCIMDIEYCEVEIVVPRHGTDQLGKSSWQGRLYLLSQMVTQRVTLHSMLLRW